MRSRVIAPVGAAARACAFGLAMLTAYGCDPCAGVPTCHDAPEISYTGQFIEHKSGDAVSNVRVEFVRTSGVEMASGAPTATSDDDGFFLLHGPVLQEGYATGNLLVTPPAPYAPYTIPDLTLKVNRVRGDGGNLGRLVVNPYLFLVGRVENSQTHAPITNATVIMRRTGGGRAAADSVSFTTDFGGQFGWEPAILDPRPIVVRFDVTAPGYTGTYTFTRTLPLSWRDMELWIEVLPIGAP